MNSSHQHSFGVSISGSSEIEVVIYELFKYLYSIKVIHFAFNHNVTFAYGSDAAVSCTAYVDTLLLQQTIGLGKPHCASVCCFENNVLIVYCHPLPTESSNLNGFKFSPSIPLSCALDHTIIPAQVSINGHLCQYTLGANHRMDNGCWKSVMKDVIWVSFIVPIQMKHPNAKKNNFRKSRSTNQITNPSQ